MRDGNGTGMPDPHLDGVVRVSDASAPFPRTETPMGQRPLSGAGYLGFMAECPPRMTGEGFADQFSIWPIGQCQGISWL